MYLRSQHILLFHYYSGILVFYQILQPCATVQKRNCVNCFMVSLLLDGLVPPNTGKGMNLLSLVLAGLATPLVLIRAYHCILRLCHIRYSGLAYHHLPALFRCRCHLLRICDGANAFDCYQEKYWSLKNILPSAY